VFWEDGSSSVLREGVCFEVRMLSVGRAACCLLTAILDFPMSDTAAPRRICFSLSSEQLAFRVVPRVLHRLSRGCGNVLVRRWLIMVDSQTDCGNLRINIKSRCSEVLVDVQNFHFFSCRDLPNGVGGKWEGYC
jgi:hypothetical protein